MLGSSCNIKIEMKGFILFFLVSLIFLFVACKGINDAPEEQGTIRFELADLKRQVGIVEDQNNSRAVVPGDSLSTNAVQSLIVGALITDRSAPYNSSLALTSTLFSALETDLIRSAQYFKITHLPTTENYIEFMVPPTSTGQWQIVAIAVSNKPVTLGEMKDSKLNGTALYMGFNGVFYSGNDGVDQAVEIKMKRACLVDIPPKGCAAYDEYKRAVVTAAVEIIDIKINNQPTTMLEYPLIVRDNPLAINTQQFSAKNAADMMRLLAFSVEPISSLHVRTTHATNPIETVACQALASKTNLTVAELETTCQVQDYIIAY